MFPLKEGCEGTFCHLGARMDHYKSYDLQPVPDHSGVAERSVGARYRLILSPLPTGEDGSQTTVERRARWRDLPSRAVLPRR